MKKYLFLILAVCMLLCSCNQADSNAVSNEIPEENAQKEPDTDYSKLHEFVSMYEKYASGDNLGEYQNGLYTGGLLIDLNKEDNFLDELGQITIPYKDTKVISSLFMLFSAGEENYYGSFNYMDYEKPEFTLEPFQISADDEQISILYGRFFNSEDGNKHWLYPVKYTATPYVLSEDDIPEILSDVFKAGEQMYKIIDVENIYDIDIVKNIYTDNGYGKLFERKSYDLTSPQDVAAMSECVNSTLYNEMRSTYNLMCDIDMSEIEFEPIGKNYNIMNIADHRIPYVTGFCGVLNGNNHSISNLSILLDLETSDNENNSIGFFSVLGRGASVKDLNILNANIDYIGEEGYVEAGILAGRINGASVENCTVSGTVRGTVDIGGLAGAAGNGYDLYSNEVKCEIINCHADVEVYGGNWIGGFIGSNTADILNCSAEGIVTCDYIINNDRYFIDKMPFGIGGFTGHNSKEIRNSGANVRVKTMVNVKWVGSFIGYNDEHAYECFYNTALSHWEPSGFSPNASNIDDITGLSQKEYYTRLSEIK